MIDLTERLAEDPNNGYLSTIAGFFQLMDENEIIERRFSENDPVLKIITEALRLIDEQKSLERRCPDLPDFKLIMAHYMVDINDLIYEAGNLIMQDERRLADLRRSELTKSRSELTKKMELEKSKIASIQSEINLANMRIIELFKSSIAIMESPKPDELGVKASRKF
jgi:hypothetical protein